MTIPCEQAENITDIKRTMTYFQEAEQRREKREERMLDAMETIAAHGATIVNLEQRQRKLEGDVTESFGLIRNIDTKITLIELRHAEEHGEEKVYNERRKFWDDIKKANAAYVIGAFWFMLWMIDKFNITLWFEKAFKTKG